MTDRLFFYSKSRDAAPGKGANEVVRLPARYATLASIPDWRKVLSNFHWCPFSYRGSTYNTIEHVFQAEKIALADPVKARWFTRESGHPIGQGDGAMAQKHRKLVHLNEKQLRAWDRQKDWVMKAAAIEKYAACPEARKVLRATREAELWHVVMRKQAVRFTHLEDIRATLRARRSRSRSRSRNRTLPTTSSRAFRSFFQSVNSANASK